MHKYLRSIHAAKNDSYPPLNLRGPSIYGNLLEWKIHLRVFLIKIPNPKKNATEELQSWLVIFHHRKENYGSLQYQFQFLRLIQFVL
jgi:hypothetical protein